MAKFFRWLSVVALLIAASIPLPYDYYTLLRFLIFGVTADGAVEEKKLGRKFWVWTLGLLAVGYNPIFRIHLDKGTWTIINLITVALLVVWLLKKGKRPS
ncbi:hypothetical protein KF728_09750 [Candidatus Obscuribacterales bacterium]|nr:hypothetical protein [Candidatus Obscuribacterales bacterium]